MTGMGEGSGHDTPTAATGAGLLARHDKLVAERDRYREALTAIVYGRVPQRGQLNISFADASNFARDVLREVEDDA